MTVRVVLHQDRIRIKSGIIDYRKLKDDIKIINKIHKNEEKTTLKEKVDQVEEVDSFENIWSGLILKLIYEG